MHERSRPARSESERAQRSAALKQTMACCCCAADLEANNQGAAMMSVFAPEEERVEEGVLLVVRAARDQNVGDLNQLLHRLEGFRFDADELNHNSLLVQLRMTSHISGPDSIQRMLVNPLKTGRRDVPGTSLARRSSPPCSLPKDTHRWRASGYVLLSSGPTRGRSGNQAPGSAITFEYSTPHSELVQDAT